jgi:hypothetical protein
LNIAPSNPRGEHSIHQLLRKVLYLPLAHECGLGDRAQRRTIGFRTL